MFKRGKSGNPAGRPKIVLADGRSLRDLAREHTQEALDTVISIMRDAAAPQTARLSAAQNIHDRGWGRPTQPISGDADMPSINWAVAPDEVVAFIAGQALADETAH